MRRGLKWFGLLLLGLLACGCMDFEMIQEYRDCPDDDMEPVAEEDEES